MLFVTEKNFTHQLCCPVSQWDGQM